MTCEACNPRKPAVINAPHVAIARIHYGSVIYKMRETRGSAKVW